MGPFARIAMNFAIRWLSRALSGEMRREKVEAAVRHALTGLGLVLVSRGIIDEAMIEPMIGVVMTAFGLIWSLGDKAR